MYDLAKRQHGLITRSQAHEAGLSRSAIARRISKGELVELSRNVLRMPAAPVTDLQQAMAGVLDIGHDAVLARWSAAAVWQISGFETVPVHVVHSRVGCRRSSTLAITHTSTVLPPSHIATVSGIPTTTPARTLCDLAAHLHPGRLDWLINKMWAKRLIDGRRLRRVLDELAVPGRRGIAVLRELVEARPYDHRPPESNLESRLDDLLRQDGQAPMQRQIDIGDDDWIGRVDFLDRRCRVVVEVQSDLFHGSLLDRERDALRRARLVNAGWMVIEVHERDVWHHPADMLRRIRNARRHRQTREPQPWVVGQFGFGGAI